MSSEAREERRKAFFEAETNHLRETRVLKAKCTSALRGGDKRRLDANSTSAGRPAVLTADEPSSESDFEVLRVLGKGSFGVVRLVREKTAADLAARKQVYAMKVIRKSEMLRSCQEGHLRAERDFLVASEGSNWIVPLVASFQDVSSLYLVMEYMPGGDFLGLLIRENTLEEAVARFYVAEMILCVEEAHALRCIHRDIKPDNFLVSASGHLKISDFGLAFDGHWSHDTGYYTSARYSLLRKLGIYVAGDEHDRKKDESLHTPGAMVCSSTTMAGLEKHERAPHTEDGEPILQWRNRCGNHTAATSVVGTSQYMAPEVVRGDKYDGRCDWWSIGVILYECLYGHTPFLAEEGRQQTKKNILNHRVTFCMPPWPPVSRRCQHLLGSLITDKAERLCSKRYLLKDAAVASLMLRGGGGVLGSVGSGGQGGQDGGDRDSGTAITERDLAGRYVFPYDAEDIKAHKFFKGLPWERLHRMPPPFVPSLSTEEDTRYFDEEAVLSDSWESSTASSGGEEAVEEGEAAKEQTRGHTTATMTTDSRLVALEGLHPGVQRKALEWIAEPYDAGRWKVMEAEMEQLVALGLAAKERDALRQFVRRFGKREKKRPRDRLLRDEHTRRVVLELRKRHAFLGYTWRRMRQPSVLLGASQSTPAERTLHRGRFWQR